MIRLFRAFLVCFCCTFSVFAAETLPPNKGAPIADVLTYLQENSITNSQQVIDYVESNNLINTKYSDDEKVRIRSYYAKSFLFLGEREQALTILEQAFDIIRSNNVSLEAQADALYVRGSVFAEMANYSAAIADLQDIIQLFPKYANNKKIGEAYIYLADIYLNQTDFKNAFDSLYKAQFVFKAIKDQAMLAFTFSRLGMIYRTIGDFDKALENMLQALKQMEGVAEERRLAVTYNNTAIIYKDLARYDEAINFHKRSLNLKQKIGYQRGMVYSYNNLGETYRLKGDLVEAQRFLDKAQMLATQLNNLMLLGSTYLYRARIAKQQGRLTDALTHLNNAMSIYQKRNSKSRIAEAGVEYGDVYAIQGLFDKAQSHYQVALEISKEVNKNVVTFAAYEGLVNVYKERGLYKQALDALTEYQTLKETLFDKQSQQRLESLIIENQLFRAQQQLKLAQQESKIKQTELDRIETTRNWVAILVFAIFIIAWLIYRKVQQNNRIQFEIETRKEIELSQQRLNLALWGSGDTLWDWDLKNGEIKRENLPSYSRFSETASDLDIDSLKEFVHPDDYGELNNALHSHIDGITPFFEASYRVLNNQGEWCWLLDRGKVVEFDDDTGKAVRITGTQRDITTLKQQEIALKELNNELEQRVLERTTELATMNQQLIHTIEKLEIAQEYIIEAEKHAALGSMVAGLPTKLTRR